VGVGAVVDSKPAVRELLYPRDTQLRRPYRPVPAASPAAQLDAKNKTLHKPALTTDQTKHTRYEEAGSKLHHQPCNASSHCHYCCYTCTHQSYSLTSRRHFCAWRYHTTDNDSNTRRDPHTPCRAHSNPSFDKHTTTTGNSSGQKFGQTMDVSQGCKQAEYQYAFWSTWLHAVMPAPHSHGCRLRVSLRAGTWQSLQNCNFTAKNRPVFASICSTQQ
jgi:hypothetical protein